MYIKAKKSGSLEDKRRLKEATKVKAKLIRHSQQRAINSIADDPSKSGKKNLDSSEATGRLNRDPSTVQ